MCVLRPAQRIGGCHPPAQCLQQFVFRRVHIAVHIRNALRHQLAVAVTEHTKHILDPADTLSLLFLKTGAQGDFIRPRSSVGGLGRRRGGRHRRRGHDSLRLRLRQCPGIALGGNNHVFDVLWHMFKFLKSF